MKETQRNAIVTMPPHAPYLDDVLAHDFVSGIRLNTVMPVKGTREKRHAPLKVEALASKLAEINEKTAKLGKDFYIDLKARQLRITELGEAPFTRLELSHEIEVYTPTRAYFHGRDESATILEVEGNTLIMQDGPRRVVGPGESVTIPHSTLKIKGFLTEDDVAYIEASKKCGIHDYMLSFVEGEEDIEALRRYDPEARITAKIESVKGLDYVAREYDGKTRLMAARGDLYMELKWPHEIPESLELILNKNPNAVVASRILSSMDNSAEPSCADVGDADNLLRMGYKAFMFGDEVCMERRSIMSAINVLSMMARRYESPGGKK